MNAAVLAIGALVAQGSPASAPVLLDKLQIGMAKSEMKALWPKRIGSIGDGCFAQIEPGYSKGKLWSVRLQWTKKDTNKKCALKVNDWARTTYGEPDRSSALSMPTACLGPGAVGGGLAADTKFSTCDPPSVRNFLSWNRNGLLVELQTEIGEPGKWWLRTSEAE
jgi:hypothetical protein